MLPVYLPRIRSAPTLTSRCTMSQAAALRDVDIQPWLGQLDVDLDAVSTTSLQLLQWCRSGSFQPVSPVTITGLMDLLAMAPLTPPEEVKTPGSVATPPMPPINPAP